MSPIHKIDIGDWIDLSKVIRIKLKGPHSQSNAYWLDFYFDGHKDPVSEFLVSVSPHSRGSTDYDMAQVKAEVILDKWKKIKGGVKFSTPTAEDSRPLDV